MAGEVEATVIGGAVHDDSGDEEITLTTGTQATRPERQPGGHNGEPARAVQAFAELGASCYKMISARTNTLLLVLVWLGVVSFLVWVDVTKLAPKHHAHGVVPFDASLVWDRSTQLGRDGPHQCHYRAASYSQSVRLCIRPYTDLISEWVEKDGDWVNCRDLSRIWNSTIMRAGSSEKDIFLDIGANIGVCTMHMAVLSDANAVVAFEPSETNLFYLTGTFLANPSYASKVQVYPVGLGNQTVDLPIFAEPGNAGHSVIGAAVGELGMGVLEKVGTIHVRRLDDIIRPPYPKVRLAKIDVEGFETNVLRGGRELFSSGAVRSIYFELSPLLRGRGSSKLELVNLFLEFGYEFHEKDGRTMSTSTLQNFTCNECPHCFDNLFAIIARHSPNAAQPRLPACR
eukprot:CAMPEP_0204110162 /NCGR_PEP_ID=MMETSP0361-20130328/1720_1 /ASSEMBLY_ACC=CAM_ASM_000343 /TAXON_ID=268821 /ORGANISM="Scrippsiella Hangoei, Strain SHTV-5" /LENGTH=399 /DNA_ID=CAMNT_0051060029 /DNA_START=51 /DNA_END=1250 /DNA_ORIENTATION=+